MSLRLAVVSPRFEPVTAVGAEVQAAGFARRLANRGHTVELLTTCARDLVTWKNHYAPGLYSDGAFPVRRFPLDPRSQRRRRTETGWRLERGETPAVEEQADWIRSRGWSSELTGYLAEHGSRYDAFIVAPAVSGTVWALPESVLKRSLLLAALPEGPKGELPILAERYSRVAAFLAGSVAERGRAADLLGLPQERIVMAAAPVADAERDGDAFRRRHGLEVPFLFCTGRRSRRKGTARLIEYVRLLVRREDVDLRLVLAGEDEVEIPADARDFVVDLHFIDDRDRNDGYAAALACCQPSREEGLGLSPLEGWLAGRPVLADAAGGVTAERCRTSGGGIVYAGWHEFAEAVLLMMREPETAAAAGRRGREFVLAEWSWERCLAEVEAACGAIAGVKAGAP